MRQIYAQMYSIKEACQKDFKNALKLIADMGYYGVEFAGYFDVEAKELKAYMDELGLKTLSSHVSMELLETELEREVEALLTLGGKYIVCPHTTTKTVAEAKALASRLNVIGKKCSEMGMPLLYHNHAHEFEIDNGVYPIETLFDETDSKYLNQQVDIYWVAYAGLDPLAYLEDHKDRIKIVHLKQIENMTTKTNVDATSGSIDFEKAMAITPDAFYVYEQEHTTGDILEDMEKSLKSLI